MIGEKISSVFEPKSTEDKGSLAVSTTDAHLWSDTKLVSNEVALI